MSGTDKHAGGCLCGAVRYKVSGEPAMAMACHCTHCQKQTGSAFSTIAGWPEAQVEVEGETRVYRDAGESGRAVERNFCPRCGSPLFTAAEASPGVLWIKTGTLDDPDAAAPRFHIWARSKQGWCGTGDLPAFDSMPEG